MEKTAAKNYVILGGSSGIGQRLATMLSKGNRVFATYNKNQQTDIVDSNP